MNITLFRGFALVAALAGLVCNSNSSSEAALFYVAGNNGQFGTIDPATGAYTSIGTTSVVLEGGLGFGPGGVLYGSDNYNLYSINTTSGSLTTVGTMPGNGYWSFGATLDGTLYLNRQNVLYAVDPATAALTFIGPTGAHTGNGIAGAADGNLYLMGSAYTGSGGNFYRVSRTSGAATLLGNGGVNDNFYGLGYTNGRMYAFDYNNPDIYTVNLVNGSMTLASTYDFSTVGQVYGVGVQLATDTATLATWSSSGGGSWADGSKWDTSPNFPQFQNDTATFGSAIVTSATVTLDGGKTVSALTFDNSNSYTIGEGSGGPLVLSSTAASAQVTVLTGTHTISAPLLMTTNVAFNVNTGTAHKYLRQH